MFELHPTLFRDTAIVGRLKLCQVLLSKDSLYPWLILVPERESIQEIYELSEPDRQQLLDESCLIAELMTNLFAPDKMNIAALGNVVPQLHLHHIARFKTDPAWPAPVWGKQEPKAYGKEALEGRVRIIRLSLEALTDIMD